MVGDGGKENGVEDVLVEVGEHAGADDGPEGKEYEFGLDLADVGVEQIAEDAFELKESD